MCADGVKKCFECDAELIWDNDFDGEDIGMDESFMVSYFHCPKCNSSYRIAIPQLTV
jgi:hypothetical protein